MSGELVSFPGGEREVEPGLLAAVEAVLFASAEPVSIERLSETIGAGDPGEVRLAVDQLARRCRAADRGVELVEVAGAFQLRTKGAFAGPVQRIRGGKPQKLTAPALETLAVIAYRQPVTRHEIEQVRGVDSGGAVRGLLDRGLVRVAGRREEPGRPLEYATTPAFLELFGLPSLSALPTLREREGLRPPDDEP